MSSCTPWPQMGRFIIRNVGSGWSDWSTILYGRFASGKVRPLPSKEKTRWASHTVWTFRRKEKYLTPVGNRTRIYCNFNVCFIVCRYSVTYVYIYQLWQYCLSRLIYKPLSWFSSTRFAVCFTIFRSTHSLTKSSTVRLSIVGIF